MIKIIYTSVFILLFGFSSIAQNALSFDGVNDKVDLGNGTALQITGTAITVEAWIYPTSWKTNVYEGGIVVKEQNSSNNGFMFRAGNSGMLNFAFSSAGLSWKELTTNANALTLNTWQHVAATYNGSMVRLYKNGVVIDSAATTGNIGNSTNNLVIGGWYSTGRNFPGKIDEVRIWNVARTTAEIANSMNGEFCGAPTGLAAYYKFNQGTAGGSNTGQTTLTDQVGSNNGTLQNFSLSGSTSNWVTGKTLIAGTGGSGTTSVNSCGPYTSPSGKYVWTQNGQYVDTISSPLGCDSILTINLTISSANSGTLTTTACNTYNSPSGRYVWSTPGTYVDTLVNMEGCDSVLTITLSINTIDTNVLHTGATLTSWATGASFQWLDCNNGYSPIPGATSQTFKATINGTYAVEVSNSTCTDTSACYTIADIGFEEYLANRSIDVYPNPASDNVLVNFNKTVTNANVELLNTTGQVVAAYNFKNSRQADVNLNVPTGVYFLKINADGNTFFKKLVIE